MKKTHRQIYKRGSFGSVQNTTICGRARHGDADLNVTTDDKAVTCVFCRVILRDPVHYAHVMKSAIDPTALDALEPDDPTEDVTAVGYALNLSKERE